MTRSPPTRIARKLKHGSMRIEASESKVKRFMKAQPQKGRFVFRKLRDGSYAVMWFSVPPEK